MAPEIKFWSSRICIALAFSVIVWKFDLVDGLSSDDARTAAGVVAQIGATMLGFVLASLAILVSVSNTKLLRNMRKTGHYSVLVARMFACIAAFGSLAVAGVPMLFAPTLHLEYVYPLITLMSLAVLLLYDVARKFWMVLKYLNLDQN